VGFEKEEYRLTGKFYSEFVVTFCEALGLLQHLALLESLCLPRLVRRRVETGCKE
jgi:hypothetical protein